MDGETITWIFFIGGILLMLFETLVPGGVSFFLGLSGVLVGGLRFLGFLAEPTTAVLTWLLTSLGLILMMRPVLMKYWGGESSVKLADEDFEAIDEVVEVIEPVNPDDNSGRIRYQGISWQARTLEGTMQKGEQARIRFRDNVTWIVEPVDELEDGAPKELES